MKTIVLYSGIALFAMSCASQKYSRTGNITDDVYFSPEAEARKASEEIKATDQNGFTYDTTESTPNPNAAYYYRHSQSNPAPDTQNQGYAPNSSNNTQANYTYNNYYGNSWYPGFYGGYGYGMYFGSPYCPGWYGGYGWNAGWGYPYPYYHCYTPYWGNPYRNWGYHPYGYWSPSNHSNNSGPKHFGPRKYQRGLQPGVVINPDQYVRRTAPVTAPPAKGPVTRTPGNQAAGQDQQAQNGVRVAPPLNPSTGDGQRVVRPVNTYAPAATQSPQQAQPVMPQRNPVTGAPSTNSQTPVQSAQPGNPQRNPVTAGPGTNQPQPVQTAQPARPQPGNPAPRVAPTPSPNPAPQARPAQPARPDPVPAPRVNPPSRNPAPAVTPPSRPSSPSTPSRGGSGGSTSPRRR